jgi:hypothetical protein
VIGVTWLRSPPSDAGPYGRRAADARGSLATGRSRKLDVCWISWPHGSAGASRAADLIHAIQRMVAYRCDRPMADRRADR